jgi:hypothetical protein
MVAVSVRAPASVLPTVTWAVPVVPVEHGLQLKLSPAAGEANAKLTVALAGGEITGLPFASTTETDTTGFVVPSVLAEVGDALMEDPAAGAPALKVTVAVANGVPGSVPGQVAAPVSKAVKVCVPATVDFTVKLLTPETPTTGALTTALPLATSVTQLLIGFLLAVLSLSVTCSAPVAPSATLCEAGVMLEFAGLTAPETTLTVVVRKVVLPLFALMVSPPAVIEE